MFKATARKEARNQKFKNLYLSDASSLLHYKTMAVVDFEDEFSD